MTLTAPQHSAFIRDALPGVSRTFALGISLLREPLRDSVGLAYLVCRVLDTLEDASDLPLAPRIALLRRAETALQACAEERTSEPSAEAANAVIELASGISELFQTDARAGGSRSTKADFRLCEDARLVFDAFLALPERTRLVTATSAAQMARGMADTLEGELCAPAPHLDSFDSTAAPASSGLHLGSEQDLDRYCYYVAGTVGELLTGLFLADRPEISQRNRASMNRHAVDFGLGLQMTNVIKDVTEDFARGVIYLPKSVMFGSGVDMDRLLSDPRGAEARAVIGRITSRALGCLDAAYAYTLAVPASERDVRVFCALPLVLALRTLGRAVTELTSFEAGVAPKVSRAEVADLQSAVESGADNDAALGALIRSERAAVVAELDRIMGDGRPRRPWLAHVALGSNVGDVSEHLDVAVGLIGSLAGVRVLREAGRIETEPVGCPEGSGQFLNGMVEVSTVLSPEELLGELLEIEKVLGRVRGEARNLPRTIDLDLVLMEGLVMGWPEHGQRLAPDGEGLTLPHPRLHERPFVLVPLLELVPEARHPVTGKPLLASLSANE